MPDRVGNLFRQTTSHSTASVPVDVSARSVALTLVAAAAVMWVLSWAREVFIPIVVSVLISYALEPVVVSLTRVRLSRVLASAMVMTLLSGTLGYGAYMLSDDAAAIVAQLPEAA